MKTRNKLLIGVPLAAVLAYSIYPSSETETTPTIIKPTTTQSKAGTFLVISDPHLKSDKLQKDWTFEDSGRDLWEAAYNHFDSLMGGKLGNPKPKFALLLGDLPWHGHSFYDTLSTRKNTGLVLAKMREIADSNQVALLYAAGNNDSWNGDYHQFSNPKDSIPFQTDRGYQKDWPLIGKGACGLTESTPCLADEMYLKKGYYSAYPLGKEAKLRIISMNSVMLTVNSGSSHHYTNDNATYLKTQKADAKEQMKWVATQLKQVDSLQEKALLIMHIPPGIDGFGDSTLWTSCLTSYSEKEQKEIPVQNHFLELIDTFQESVIGILTSHTHLDGIRKLQNKDSVFTDLLISIPGIPLKNGNNSAMKVIEYNKDYELTNFTTHYNSFDKSYSYPVNSWKKGNHFTFKDKMNYTDSITMRDFVAGLDTLTLLQGVQSFYKAGKSSWGDEATVKRTLWVNYQTPKTHCSNH